jgi:enoyl-CoA hydratase/carnithine racemase
MMSARWLDAQEAHTIGLVNFVTSETELQDKAMDFAVKLTERSRHGLAEMKRLAREGICLESRQAMRLEADAAARHILSPDTEEGLAAFEARRKPIFR